MALDPQLQKVPPQNLEAEQMVLGAVLIENSAIDKVIDQLAPGDFYRDAHRKIYATMLEMHDKRESIDLITMPDRLTGSGSLEAVGGASYLAQLVSLVPTAANIASHARIVREKSLYRRGIHAANEIVAKGYDDANKMTGEEFVDYAEGKIFEVAQKKAGHSLTPSKLLMGESFRRIEHRYENKGKITGIATGFVDLDEKTTGIQPADLVIVAGRPSMGKTAFVLNIAEHAAVDRGKNVAIFSLEMSKESLMDRMLASRARVDAHKLRTGYIAERDWMPLSNAAGLIAEAGLYIDDTAAISAMDLRAKCRRMKAEHGIDLVIVDYLQLMSGKGDEGNREQEISGISRALKALAKELQVPVIALSQLNRSVETRQRDKRPGLSDLRESGAIEQDADVIIFLYREEVYNKCECPQDGECLCNRRGKAEAIIGKQRNGPIGIVPLTFLNRITRFENAPKESGVGIYEGR